MEPEDIITPYRNLSDEDLVGLLHQAGDRFPGEAVTEIALRNDTTVVLIRAIIEDRREWAKAGVSSWAAIHAFRLYLDFEMGDEGWSPGSDRWPALIAAARFAMAYDLDEGPVTDWPLIVAAQGPWVWRALPALARDRTRPLRERQGWLLALCAAAKRDGGEHDKYLDILAGVASDNLESRELRARAARRLLDWVRPKDRALIEKVAREEKRARGFAEVLPEEVEPAFARGAPDLTAFAHDHQRNYYRDYVLGKPPPPGPLPLPSWREEERESAWRACEPLLASEAERAAAGWLLDTLVIRRASPVRAWRLLDIAAAVEAAARKPADIPEAARGSFAAATARVLEVLGARELTEIGDWREMAGWVRRREERLREVMK
ncbi:MAG: hypothetical protein K8T20_17950 [Planctomycetes bacterium]|nr:hypothetical protein [Planctomycetota bacterium]